MSRGLNVRLSAMMFLQYAIWGAWLPLLWPFLNGHRGFDAGAIGDMFAVGAVGALIAPFIAGEIADRYFPTQIFLGVSHLIGAVLVWQLADLEAYESFLIFSLLYSIIYAPTLSLTNSLAFHHLPDRDRDFGRVRLWGTVGWIVVGITIGQWLLRSHTITQEEATERLVTEKIVDADARRELLESSQLTLKDDRSVVGKIVSREGGTFVLEVRKGEKTERAQVSESEIKTMRPLYDAFAAPNKGAILKGALEQARAAGVVQPALAAKMVGDLASGKVFNDTALQGPIGRAHAKGMADAFRLSAILGALMGLFCFTLPHTPPSRSVAKNASMRALKEVRRNPLLTLFLIAVPVSCIHQFYFVHTAGFLGSYQLKAADALNSIFGVGGSGLMTIGQLTEIGVLAAIPLLTKRVPRKTFLAVGLGAYAVRMALFAYVDAIPLPPLVTLILGVACHGLCFGCFIFVAFMIVDEETTKDVRASAQSLFNLVIVGVGIIVGSKVAGSVAEWATSTDTFGARMDYRRLFGVPMWGSLACLVLLLVFYPRSRETCLTVEGDS